MRNSSPLHPLLIAGMVLLPLGATLRAGPVPTAPPAPPIPTCAWDATGLRSDCKFKDALSGTPTSVVGNKVILYRRSASGGYGDSRKYLQDAISRLASRYGFTAMVSESPAIFDSANLMDAKVVIMSHGDGDVVPPGPNRSALEAFQLEKGWGILWIHSACAFITSAWPFGQQNCVQQFAYGVPGQTPRRIFLDSGTASDPNHGIRNPQSEFLLRDLPGWNGNRALQLSDRWFCFREPARNTAGVNVLFGFDRSSGLHNGNCPEGRDSSETASQNHNLAWTHRMGQGISLYNSWGQDPGVYTDHGNMGDSLLWRYIRYLAKDWCVTGSGEPGCDGPLALPTPDPLPEPRFLQRNGALVLAVSGTGRYQVSFAGLDGRHVKAASLSGPGVLEIPGLPRGLYLVTLRSGKRSRTHRILIH